MQSPTLSSSSPWRKLLLTIHIAATVSVLGADLVLLVLALAGVGGADQRTIYPAASLVGTWLLAPLALVSLAGGILLGLLTTWGVLKYWWVAIKLAITTTLTVAVLFVLLPRLGAAAEAVAGPSARLLSSSERLALVVAPVVASMLLLLNVALATFKPPWRLRSRPAAEAPRLRAQQQHE